VRSGAAWLIAGGCLSLAAAALHLAVIAGGANWYRFVGAGERMARSVERGMLHPTLITIGIAGVLTAWAYYAFAGAGLVPRPPLLRAGLAAITAVYLVRGLVIVPMLLTGRADSFWIWSSAIVLVYGVVHAIGTWRAWP
jgi:hypothetical protein